MTSALRTRPGQESPAWTGLAGCEQWCDCVLLLPRLTTQWSVEDEEEAARERRRRERDRQLRAQDEDRGGQSPELPEQETL